jgi:hypothetical protein
MERLRDPAMLLSLTQYLAQHLGTQYLQRLPTTRRDFSEEEKWRFAPLIFGLMPRKAAVRDSIYKEIKPEIRSHLALLGIEPDDLLVDLIKEMCDNFDRSRPANPAVPRIRARKASIGDLRLQSTLHQKIRTTQNQRCAVCGVLFTQGTPETLDHVIPWRVGGDPADGANWQLLCGPCNEAKANFFCGFAMIEYSNWIYVDSRYKERIYPDDYVSTGNRFLVLATARQCRSPGCTVTPRDSELFIVRSMATGFSVFDYLSVRCAAHVAEVAVERLRCGVGSV